MNEERRKSENRNSYWTYAYVGPGGGATGSYAAFPSPRTNATRYGDVDVFTSSNPPAFVNREALGENALAAACPAGDEDDSRHPRCGRNLAAIRQKGLIPDFRIFAL